MKAKCDCCGKMFESESMNLIVVKEKEFDGMACGSCEIELKNTVVRVYTNMYPDSKLDALAKHLQIHATLLRVWSDDSITVGNEDTVEYYVSKRKLKREQIGTEDGFRIFKS